MKPRYLGMAIVAVSIIVLASLFYLNSVLSKQSLENCIEFCNLQKDSSCSLESCKANGQHNDHEKIISALELLIAFLIGIGFYLSLTKAEKIIEQTEIIERKRRGMTNIIFLR